jgi:predicted amidophosphoribosyltransferase
VRQFFCLLCHAFIYENESIFCDHCSDQISKIKVKKRSHDQSEHFYLFSWSQKNDLFCRSLVYSLKRRPLSHFLFLASLFSQVKDRLKYDLICPVGGSKGPDHAQSFALALMKLFGAKSVIPLKPGFSNQQKLKRTRFERLAPLDCKFLPRGDWLFVDDVFVTGATCYKISEQVKARPSVILSLFYKEKECP